MQITSVDRPLHLLLIEDNKGDALLIERTLKSALPGTINIARAVCITDALALLAEQEFDIALLDRSLPDVEGFSGLYSIQNFAPKLPVVFLTAFQDESIAFAAIEQGAQDYLFKDRIDSHAIKRAVQYAILRKQFEGVLIMRANFDMLTGLANRVLFDSRLEFALAKIKRRKGNIALLFLDLDKFKEVNDTYGHAAGDNLLKEIGNRIKSIMRSNDTAARLGGDEFALLLEDMPDSTHVEAVAQKILRLFDTPFLFNDQKLNVCVSIGIAYSEHISPVSGDELIKIADEAMYSAKAVHGNCYRFASECFGTKKEVFR